MGAEHASSAGDIAHLRAGSHAGAASCPQEAAPGSDLASTIVELAPDGILVVDPDGQISFANPAAAAMFGYPRQDMTGLSVDALVPTCLRLVHARHRRGYIGEPSPRPMGMGRDLMGRRADGSEVPLEVSLSPVSLAGRQATIAVVRVVRRPSDSALRQQLLAEEDERIAAELHDRIIKRLFLAGMKIQSVLTLTDTPVYQQLNETVDQLDTIIREIRHTVFAGVLAGGRQGQVRSTWS